jgi:hypothetical protein
MFERSAGEYTGREMGGWESNLENGTTVDYKANTTDARSNLEDEEAACC